MIRIQEAIIVEGKYDKIKLSSFVDGLILETGGFRIFQDKRQMALIRRLADTQGIVVLTDSDAAGFVIRNHLAGSVDRNKIKHAYIPDIFGKEKRKEKASREGKLGVEGVESSLIVKALTLAGATFLDGETQPQAAGEPITKADLFAWGLSGGEGSAARRRVLLEHLNLPEHLAPNALVAVLNRMYARQACQKMVEELFLEDASKK